MSDSLALLSCHISVSEISEEEWAAQSPLNFQGGRLHLRHTSHLCNHSPRLTVSAPRFTRTGVLACDRGCSFPLKLILRVSEPGPPLGRRPEPAAEVPPCAATISPFTGDTSTLFSFLLPFPFSCSAMQGSGLRLLARQASPLIVFSVRQVERNETPTLWLRWLSNYFCVFNMSNCLGGDYSRAISLQETHLFAPGRLGSNCTEKGKKQRKCPGYLG